VRHQTGQPMNGHPLHPPLSTLLHLDSYELSEVRGNQQASQLACHEVTLLVSDSAEKCQCHCASVPASVPPDSVVPQIQSQSHPSPLPSLSTSSLQVAVIVTVPGGRYAVHFVISPGFMLRPFTPHVLSRASHRASVLRLQYTINLLNVSHQVGARSRTMATAHQIVIPATDTGLLKFPQDDATAAKVSELLQKDLEVSQEHHQ
jgi:hypothetical protein